MKRYVDVIQELSLPLLAGVTAALVWANLAPDSYAALLAWSPVGSDHYNLVFIVNDLFMALFFAIAAGEIAEACLPGGSLNPIRRAINPLIGTIGGVIGPALVFLLFARIVGAPEIARGWGIPTATDIALAWLVVRLIFGRSHPAVSFLLLLAIADDAIGLVIIAVFYPDPAHPVEPIYLALVLAATALAYLLRRGGVRSFWIYLAGPGALSWFGLHSAHVHPALALVFVVPLMPSMHHDEGLFAESEDSHDDTLNRFQHTFRLPVDIGLFGFGLANAGVALSGVGDATWAVLFGLIVGKTIGVFGASMLAHALGFPLPEGVSPGALVVVALTSALGLTVALFVAGVAYTDPAITSAAKMGALLSIAVAPLAIGLARVMRRLSAQQQQPGLTPPAPLEG